MICPDVARMPCAAARSRANRARVAGDAGALSGKDGRAGKAAKIIHPVRLDPCRRIATFHLRAGPLWQHGVVMSDRIGFPPDRRTGR